MKKRKISLGRRAALKSISMGAGMGALSFLPGCSDQKAVKAEVPKAAPGIIGKDGKRVLPWSNWSGNQRSQPSLRKVPRNEEQLRELVANSNQTIRCVGAGHSFSGLVPTEDTLISLARFRGIKQLHPDSKQVDLGAGTLLSQIGEPLWEEGLALINMPDINTQSLAGAIATSTHGTGATMGSMSSDVTQLRLVDAQGEIMECSANKNTDVFHAARNNLGSLGVVTQVRMQARGKYKLEEKSWVMPLQEALEQAETLRDNNRHFEMYAFPHADYMLMLTINEVPLETENRALSVTESSSEAFRTAANWIERLPFLRSFILNTGLTDVEADSRIDRNYNVFGNLRDILFNEMEYSIPAEYGVKCLREILDTIKRLDIDIVFPLEYRYVKQDDIWLSPFYKRDSCSISCHNFHDKDYKKYFSIIEPIFHKYDGRPHWGKINTLNAADFKARYPKFDEFQRVRKELDPKGKFLNAHLKNVLEVS